MMDIKGRTVCVIGGWGLVGSAVCRKLMERTPKRIIVTSLKREEAEEAVSDLQKEYPHVGKDFFIPWWGNIFVRQEFKDTPREEILADEKKREVFMHDILGELNDAALKKTAVYQLLWKYKPEIVVDCVNSATAIAYQDIFQSSRDVLKQVRAMKAKKDNNLIETTERLLCTLYVPQIVRHVQIMYRSMIAAKTKIYVKIGTSGTGGMGFNIPYTHSEEKPSRVLLSKSSVAGAHTMLLFLMGRTPDGPITKEIKPTAAIAWKKIAYGEIKKRGKPVELFDCPPEKGFKITNMLPVKMAECGKPLGKKLKSVYIDTGENGIFSRGEFEAISMPGQMEYVTPEEIAESVVYEILGGNTGHDIINALDHATLEPTFRAGVLLESALKKMKQLEKKHGTESVAFEMLGPPRLSKLLYESYLLKRGFKDMLTVSKTAAKSLSKKLTDIITKDTELRARIISIGIPILMPDGKTLLRGKEIKIPPYRGENEFLVNPKSINLWAHDGWVDLRVKNMEVWKKRLNCIFDEVNSIPEAETSSRFMRNKEYWKNFKDIEPGKIVGWIFTVEELGERMKA
ncbi:MAG: short-chain dehydrogenase [Bacteroidota bacterium]